MAQRQWEIYAGGYSTSWQTDGHHGHDVVCPPAEQPTHCEPWDFGRSNLDNSIGFRLGAERPTPVHRRLMLFHGGEISITETEYNVSQRDLLFGAAFLTGGAGTEIGGFRVGLRAGVGAGTSDDGHRGLATFGEAAFEVPIARSARFRLAHRRASLTGTPGEHPRSADTSYLLVFTNTPAATRWSFGAGAGLAVPGKLVGDDLELTRAPHWRVVARRPVGDRSALAITHLASAHESRVKTTFLGFPGNERGKTINSIAVDWLYELARAGRLRFDAGAGLEIADWSDEHELLPRDAATDGVAGAAALELTAHLPLRRAVSVFVSAEQLYWTPIGLGETRISVGLMSAP